MVCHGAFSKVASLRLQVFNEFNTMLYFLALFCPPLAAAWCGGIGGFILNLILTVCGVVPGIVHALFVTNRFYSDRRHAETLAALTGKPMVVTHRGADGLLAAFALVIFIGFAGLVLPSAITTYKSVTAKANAAKEKRSQSTPEATEPVSSSSPVLVGWSFTEVESTYGKALSTDKASGWAIWPKFRARFEGGNVVEAQSNTP